MKTSKAIIAAGLMLIANSVFAGYVTQCPPASALHHNGAGQPWTLDPEYQSKGWYVFEQPFYSKDSNLTISDKSTLSVSIRQEEMYVLDSDHAYTYYNYGNNVGLYYPVSCAYVDKVTRSDGYQFLNSIVVKSSIYNFNDWNPFDHKWTPIYDEHSVNVFKKTGDSRDLIYKGVEVCITTAGAPEACPLREWNPESKDSKQQLQ